MKKNNSEFQKYKKFSFPLNVYAFITYFNTGEFRELHYGLFSNSDDDLIQAQKNSTDLLFQHLFKAPAKLLEVGIGLGKTHQKLIDKGFDCVGITPDQIQIDIVQEKIPEANLICIMLEKFETEDKFDIVLFQESSQYIETQALFKKVFKLLKENGRILIVDEFAIGSGELHEINQFKQVASKLGFELIKDIDLSLEAQPTESYILDSLHKYRKKLQNELDLKPELIEHLVDAVLEHQDEYEKKTRGYFFLEFHKKAKSNLLVTKKKKALVLTKLPLNALGGIEKIAQNIVDLLEEYNWDVYAKSTKDFLADISMRELQKKSGNLFDYIAPGYQLNCKEYDLIITNNFFAGTLYPSSSTKVITLVHGLFTAISNEMEKDIPNIKQRFKNELMIEDMAYRHKSKLISIVKHVQTDLNKYFGLDSILIYNGFDYDFFSKVNENFREKYNIEKNKIVGLYAGRWDLLQKRPDIILDLTKKFPEVLWIFATDKDITKECAVAQTGTNILVIQTISYDKMPNLYGIADFCIQLSTYEGISNFAMESIASKTPMVSTNVSILPEVYPGTKLEDLLIAQSFDRDIVLKRAEEKVQLLLNNLDVYKKESQNIWSDCKKKFSLKKWKVDMARELEL